MPSVGSARLPWGSIELVAACENTQLVDAFQAADKALYKAKRDGGDVEAALLKRARAFRKINPAYAIPKELFRAEAAVTTNVESGRASAHNALDQVFDGLQNENASSFECLVERQEERKQEKNQKRDEDLQIALFGSSDAENVEPVVTERVDDGMLGGNLWQLK